MEIQVNISFGDFFNTKKHPILEIMSSLVTPLLNILILKKHAPITPLKFFESHEHLDGNSKQEFL